MSRRAGLRREPLPSAAADALERILLVLVLAVAGGIALSLRPANAGPHQHPAWFLG